MKKHLTISLICFMCFFSFSQENKNLITILDEGIALNDKGNYNAAIAKYDEALKLDKNNLIALSEKAFSLNSLKEYESSIKTCQTAIKSHPNIEGLKFVYTTYANALDGSKKPQEALNIYNEGIKLFPNHYQLHFNKGITLSGLQNYEDALLSFEKSVTINPKHESSHNTLGRILMVKKKKIPSLLALSRFLILEPQGNRAEINLSLVKKIMTANADRTNKNNITLNTGPGMLSKNKNAENDFSSVELTLSSEAAAIDQLEDNKNQTEVELFIQKFEIFCFMLKKTQKKNTGFYWDYYAPYFIELGKNGMVETFAYTIFSSSNDESIIKWLASNKREVEAFYNWSSNYNWN